MPKPEVDKNTGKPDAGNLHVRFNEEELDRGKSFYLTLYSLNKTVRPRRQLKRYQKDIHGERVQLDVFKFAPGLYQYIAIDDCTHFRILDFQPRKISRQCFDF